MSWFTKNVEHPAINALSSLMSHPAIASNPAAAKAVTDAAAAATAIASASTNAAQSVAAAAEANADPILQAAGGGLTAVVDAYLMTLGAPGEASIGVANAVMAMGEQWIHDYIAALFVHAKAAHAAAKAAP